MKLQELYSLRKNFTVIGLTGRVGSGCSEIAKKLSSPSFNSNILSLIKEDTIEAEEIKYKICANYLSNTNNWFPFKTIHYRDVLLFHLFHEGVIERNETLSDSIKAILEIIFQNGENGNFKGFTNRFDKIDDKDFYIKIHEFLTKKNDWFAYIKELSCGNLNECLSDKREDKLFFDFYFNYFENFSNQFFDLLNEYNITKRTRLVHDLANNLRNFGTVKNLDNLIKGKTLENIYTVAETINKIIKNWKYNSNQKETKIVIDALKNSLELMFFKEKFSAFYMIATNKDDKERQDYVLDQIKSKYSKFYKVEDIEKHAKEILCLDEREYDGNEVNDGEFSVPDTENCIQKSDYHIYFSIKKEGAKESKVPNIKEVYNYLSLDRQIVKLIALIHQPGIVTPTPIERSMQIAYNAKFNSGCISRQVGALVTDNNYTVKAIGWNDVPQSQIPCNLRSVNDLINNKNPNYFSDFEKGIVDETNFYKNGQTFKQNFTDVIHKSEMKELEGKNCSFCFKSFHNAFEGEKNQVHTRSLHAEENAMLQISKYGGQGLKGGNLFTTASPCELCSKKAFQLGIENIYYIDPYPGISSKHILKNGVAENKNPKLIMFQGAVGRAFHKLYEPFMAYKDELSILTGINPKVSDKQKIESLTKDDELRKKIEELMNDHNSIK
jgi:deoxycytidylate deaminase